MLPPCTESCIPRVFNLVHFVKDLLYIVVSDQEDEYAHELALLLRQSVFRLVKSMQMSRIFCMADMQENAFYLRCLQYLEL